MEFLYIPEKVDIHDYNLNYYNKFLQKTLLKFLESNAFELFPKGLDRDPHIGGMIYAECRQELAEIHNLFLDTWNIFPFSFASIPFFYSIASLSRVVVIV